MATIDANILLQGQQVDPMRSMGQALQLRSLLGQQRVQDLQQEQTEREMADSRTLADLYRGAVKPDGSIDRSAVLSGAASQGLGARIPGLQKQFAEADQASAQLGQTRAQTQETALKSQAAGLKLISDGMSQLAANPNVTHDDVIRWAATLPADLVPPERTAQVIRSLPGDPRAMRQMLLTFGMTADQRLKALTPQFQSIDGGNRVVTGTVDPMSGQFTPQGAPIQKAPEGFVIGADGRLTADPGYLAAKQKIASAGRSVTNLNVNTAKGFTAELATGLGKQVDASLASAQAAVGAINTAQAIRQLAEGGNVITGPGAEMRVTGARLAEVLGVGGKDNAEKLANTSALVQQLAKTELDAAQALKGQGQITDAERSILRRAAAGEINMTPSELVTLSGAIEKTARARITQHQTQVERLGQVEGAAPLMPFYRVDAPPGGQPAAAPAPAAPGAAAAAPRSAGTPAPAVAAPAAPKIGEVQDGWVYNGGDPSQPSSWRKVK